jgi:O-antigen biosynthesis protein
VKTCVSLLICLAVLGSAYAQMPDEASHHLSNAESLKASGQWDAALREYRAAAALAPNDPETHFLFGIALYRQQLFDEAVQEFTLSVRLDPGVVQQDALNNALASQQYFRAAELQRHGDWDAAIKDYQRAIDVDPRDERTKIPDLATEHCSLAIALRQKGNVAKAQDHLQQAYVLHTRYSQTEECEKLWQSLAPTPAKEIARADQLKEQMDLAGAMDKYRAVLAMNPSAADAAHVHMQMAEVLRSLGGHAEEAVANAREAARLQPDAATYRELATVLEWDGKAGEAMIAYENGVRLNPRDAELHYDFGKVLIENARPDAGITEMRKTLELHPRERDLASLAHEGIAVALKDKGETESAIAELKVDLTLKPSNDTASSAHCMMAEILKGQGKTAEARREAVTADDLDPHDAEGGGGCAATLWNPGQTVDK